MRQGRYVGILAAALLVWFALSSMADARLPDWARAIADSAPPLPEGISEHRSRVLLSETSVLVEPDGRLRMTRRVASQALSPRADAVGMGYFHFDEDTKIVRSKAWHLPPEGRGKKSRDAAVDIALDNAFLNDQMTRFVKVDDTEKGSLVFFEFEALKEPEHLAYQDLFYEPAPAEVVRFKLETPPGWSVEHAWLRQAGPEPTSEGSCRVWEMRDLQVAEDEPLGESPADKAALLVVNIRPSAGSAVGPAVLKDWAAVAAFYADLAEGRADAIPKIVAQAEEVYAEAGEDPFSRIGAAARFVRDQVRYVAKEVGIGGLQPRPAGDVLDQLFGDCKDKGTLLMALLAADGRTAYPIIINATTPQTVSEDVPSLGAFNHFVVGVALEPDATVPEKLRHAVVEAGDLGRLLVLDTTSELTSIGYIPTGLQGKTGLLVAAERSRLIEIPVGPPSAHRIERRIEMEIEKNLTVRMRIETTRYGSSAASYRHAFRESEKDYREATEEDCSDLWPRSELEELTVVEETEDGGFAETIVVKLASPENRLADKLSIFPMALENLPRVTLGRRETDVLYKHAMAFKSEATISGLQEHIATPTEKRYESEGWSARSEYSRDGETLHGSWELEIIRLRYGTEELRDLKKLWSSARRSSSKAVLWGAPPE